MKKKVFVVSSTHWDREWYDPFQKFRFRLVRFFDGLIDIMKNNAEYKYFFADGQTIMIEDYLEIRPENREILNDLLCTGRIIVGPWYCMPDEMLISGEGLVRNLQKGLNICKKFNVEPSSNLYVCDIFGHNSQLPQITKLFELSSATVFRGIGDYNKDAFIWKGADGSELLTFKLDNNSTYSTYFFTMRWDIARKSNSWETILSDDEYCAQMMNYLERNKKRFSNENIMIIDGCDHIDADIRTPEILKILNKGIPEYEFIHSNFEDYIKAVIEAKPRLESIEGVLYNVGEQGLNNAVLKNVLSSNVDQKQKNSKIENMLVYQAEPLDLYTKLNNLNDNSRFYRNLYPRRNYLDKVWLYFLENQAHDSICGCSVKSVHEDNMNRYKQAEEMLEPLILEELETVSRKINTNGKGKSGSIVIFNNSQLEINEYRKFTLERDQNEMCDRPNLRLYNNCDEEIDYNLIDVKKEWKRVYDYGKLIDQPIYNIYTLVAKLKIAPFSYTVLTYDFLENKRDFINGFYGFTEFYPPKRSIGSLFTSFNEINNGKIRVVINSNGTIDVYDLETHEEYLGLLLFEDGGDAGEGWNYKKPFVDKITYSNMSQFSILFDSNILAEVEIVTSMLLPKQINGLSRSDEKEYLNIKSVITIFAESKKISIKTSILNSVKQHRLRVLFPVKKQCDVFYTSMPFDVYEWTLLKDNGHTQEIETGVVPNQGLVFCKNENWQLNIYNKGLYETALVDNIGKKIALTLYRSIGEEVCSFAEPYGSYLNKSLTFEYELEFGQNENYKSVLKSNNFKSGLLCWSEKKHGGEDLGALVEITGEAVISSVSADCVMLNGEIYDIIRIYDVSNGTKGCISFSKPIKKVYEINLRGSILFEHEVFDGKIYYELMSKQIKTFAFIF